MVEISFVPASYKSSLASQRYGDSALGRTHEKLTRNGVQGLAYQVKSCLSVTEQPIQVAQYNVHIKIYHFLKKFTIILFLKDILK